MSQRAPANRWNTCTEVHRPAGSQCNGHNALCGSSRQAIIGHPSMHMVLDVSLETGASSSVSETRLVASAVVCFPPMQAEPHPGGSCVQATAKGAALPRWLQPGLHYNAPPPTPAASPLEPPWLATPVLCSSSSVSPFPLAQLISKLVLVSFGVLSGMNMSFRGEHASAACINSCLESHLLGTCTHSLTNGTAARAA